MASCAAVDVSLMLMEQMCENVAVLATHTICINGAFDHEAMTLWTCYGETLP